MGNNPGSRNLIEDLQPGDHLCCIYETEDEHRAVLAPFLRQGLERGEKVLYIVDTHTAEAILDYLREDGVDVEPYLASGQLGMLTRGDAYMRGGVFDPDAMIVLLKEETERALTDGHTALRVTGEMTWALRSLPGSERLIEYEAKLNRFFPSNRCLAICQYDRRRFDADLLLDVLRTHPMAVIGAEIYDNFYYIPPAELLGQEPKAAEMRRWIHNLKERAHSEATRARAEADIARASADIARASDALRESQRALETLMNNLPGIAYRCRNDREWTMEFISQGCLSLTGYQPSDLVHNKELSYAQLIHPDDRESVWEDVQAALKEHRPFRITYRIVTAAGEEKWVWEQGRGIPGPDGALSFLEGFVTDITERRRVAEELRKHREHLEDLVEERTANLRQMVNAMAGREVRMAELKEVIKKLRAQLEDAGLEPVADDPLLGERS